MRLCSFSLSHSPHEPDPEPYEPIPPKLIPLDEVSVWTQQCGGTAVQGEDISVLFFTAPICLLFLGVFHG